MSDSTVSDAVWSDSGDGSVVTTVYPNATVFVDQQTPALRERVITHADYLASVIANTRRKVQVLEEEMNARQGGFNAESGKALLEMRRIIAALEMRLDLLTAALERNTESAIYKAAKLTLTEIPIPNDAVHALITEAPTPPLNPQLLQHTLNKLIAKASPRSPRKFSGY
jgi:hypothetical protein